MSHPDIRRLQPGARFHQATIHNGTVYLAGQVGRAADRSTYGQTEEILRKVDALLAEAGTDKSRVLSATVWMTDIAEADEMNRAWDAWVDKQNMPVRATVQSRLVADDITVEIGVIAALPSPAKILATDKAAAAVGPYNQGVVVDDGTVYVSGCIGLLPGDGGMVDGGVEGQTRQALENIRAILNSTGAGPNDIVKTGILLDDMADFAKVNAIYKDFFGAGDVPARSCFAAKELPKGALVEIEATAKLPYV
ncbi:unnamed protein product [Chondrus crispus]|uniref:Uncharacterized protein n=1 Tax=Chondrus crispus TaxID=2769 RepID=R7QTC6_CHOCR|nr:unnamed protein product [Chondrus crispus]CDF40615.1 unnamed protein product [Chondrus crispus]|eukprot:XP_005710909.1 unnamed protein product [Chondrus crispus]